MKLAFFDTKPYDKPGFDEHIAGTDIEIKYFETRLGEDTVQLAKGFDGVCVFVNDTVNAKVVNELYDLGVRVVALRCAGFNNVDTKACFGKLHVFRVPAYSPYAVAEHAMALLLTVNRHTNKAYIRTRDFNFSLSGLTGFDLHGKTVGVVGTGKIGRIFAGICKGFGMRVLAYDKFPNPESNLDYVELSELLRQADVISLHCPLTDETRHMIDADAIAQMKPGVVLVNTSRGERLARAGRGLGNDVLPLHEFRDGLGLDAGRVSVALLLQRLQNLLRQAKVGKRQILFHRDLFLIQSSGENRNFFNHIIFSPRFQSPSRKKEGENVNSKCEKNIKKYNQASRANSSRHSANTISAVFQPNISRG